MSAYVKDILREIRTTLGRFLSLVVISALGASIVVGIQAAAVNMRLNADTVLREHLAYDVMVTAPLGLLDADVAALAAIDGVRAVAPARQADVFTSGTEALVVRAHELPVVAPDAGASGSPGPATPNQVAVVTGTLPTSSAEIAVEERLLDLLDLEIGQRLTLMSGEVPGAGALTQSSFTITGTVTSPLYISLERGMTPLGDGRVNAFAYLHPDAFDTPATVAHLLMDGSDALDQMSQEYWDAGTAWRDQVEAAAARLTEEGQLDGPLLVSARRDGIAYYGYFQDTLRLERIGYVFPLVFYVVAIMVSLTTMSRMVEEHRGQVGAYRALGYGPGATMAKFVVYGLLASASGGVLGVLAGSTVLPRVITDAYGHLYTLPDPPAPIHWGLGAIALGGSVACVLAATVITGAGTMRSAPAVLMRPRPPAAGQRVLLERVGFLWRRLSFLGKVAYRNMSRYKVRSAMTIIGTAACCALLLTGFGLRDSVGAVGERQFADIVAYDARLHLHDGTAVEQQAALTAALLSSDANISLLREEAMTARAGDRSVSVQVITPAEAGGLDGFLTLPDIDGGRPHALGEHDVLLTDRAAGVLGVRAGSELTLVTPAAETVTVRVTGIVRNYVEHYLYLAPDAFAHAFGTDAAPNSAMASGADEADLRRLQDEPFVTAVIRTADVRASLAESTDAMGVVTWVLIILAGALAFVVLFNLATITMTERHRELATIKVLGMNTGELSMYVFRENVALTTVGIAGGLGAGVLLHRFVLDSVQVDIVTFPEVIHPASYLLAIALTGGFAALVNLTMIPRLRTINMVESLKSVE